MKRSVLPLSVLLVAICLVCQQRCTLASIVATGSCGPGAPASWASSTTAWVGSTSDGTLTVDSDSDLLSGEISLGYHPGRTGVVTVDGPGSTWSNQWRMYVGRGGSGTLNITNGAAVNMGSYGVGYIGYESGSTGAITVDGADSTFYSGESLYVGDAGHGTLNINGGAQVTVDYNTHVAAYPGATGAIQFGAGGGTLTTGSLWASANQVSGTGTINVRGLVSDFDLVFDSPASLTQTLAWNSLPGQDVTIELDLTDPLLNDALGAGYQGTGSLTIRNGMKLDSFEGSVAYAPGSTGVVNIEGSGTEWSPWAGLSVGGGGQGTLNITGGAAVRSGYGWVGSETGATGVVNVDGAGSEWANDGRIYLGDEGNGTLNVTNGAAVSNWDFIDVGNAGSGTLNITGGGSVVTEGQAYLGSSFGSVGAATVAGAGSTWTIARWLEIGSDGKGILDITDGGAVSTGNGGVSLAWWADSEAIVKVDGNGSTWTNTGELEFGEGTGQLRITNGGTVAASDLSLSASSLLAIDIGKGSLMNLGTGEITNDGRVRMTAGADAAPGDYSPINAGSWGGSGVYEPIGGLWDTSSHVFTVAELIGGAAGTQIEIDLADAQRIVIDDAQTGWSVGASFAPTAASTTLKLEASPISGDSRSALESLLEPDQSLLAGWEFLATEGYSPGDPAYLSFDIGAGFLLDNLMVWHDDGAGWDSYAAPDLTYDGQHANFAVLGFSGYALSSAAVPEPSTLAMLASGLVGVLVYARRRSRPTVPAK